MNVQELRLGNHIYISHKQALNRTPYIMTLGAIMDLASNGSGSSYFYEPIHITEEWLFKLGFNKFKGDNYDFWLGDFETACDMKIWFWKGTQIKIQYVHQLQNLYFALTGSELTVA